MTAFTVPRLCAQCGKGIRQRAPGKQGRGRTYCAACYAARSAGAMRSHHVERAAALKYCRAHKIDALAWLSAQPQHAPEDCQGCGRCVNNAAGGLCPECAAGQEA